ncbi:MAG: DoxX family protein [Actinomadura sp.]
MYRWIPAPVADLVLLLARVAIGIIFFAHGWRKLTTMGLAGTEQGFRAMGAPAPALSSLYSTFVELIGGALLIIGALVPLAGLLLFLNMAGALLFVHLDKGLFVDKGGYELVLALGAASLMLAALGGGRYGVDGRLGRHHGRDREEQLADRLRRQDR